jgi:hypothetical protein
MNHVSVITRAVTVDVTTGPFSHPQTARTPHTITPEVWQQILSLSVRSQIGPDSPRDAWWRTSNIVTVSRKWKVRALTLVRTYGSIFFTAVSI